MGLRALWEELPDPHRRWVLWNALVITAAINLAINAGIAWASVAGEEEVPLWATPLVEGPSTIGQAVGTLFLLPLITALACTTAVWHDRRSGRLPSLAGVRLRPALARLPATRLRRGLTFGAVSTIALAPLAVIALIAIDLDGLSRGGFVLYAAALGVALGALVTPLIAIRAMADESPAGAEGPEIDDDEIEAELESTEIETDVTHQTGAQPTHQAIPSAAGVPIAGGALGRSNVDAMGLDKHRRVMGRSYGPSATRQATVYGVFVAVLAVVAIGFFLLAKELDQAPSTNSSSAPWAAPGAPQNPPRALE